MADGKSQGNAAATPVSGPQAPRPKAQGKQLRTKSRLVLFWIIR